MTNATALLRQLRERVGAPARGLAIPIHPAVAGAIILVLLSAFAYAPLLGGGIILTGDTLHPMRIFELGR